MSKFSVTCKGGCGRTITLDPLPTPRVVEIDGKKYRFGDTAARPTLESNEIACDTWGCGVCGAENIVPVVANILAGRE